MTMISIHKTAKYACPKFPMDKNQSYLQQLMMSERVNTKNSYVL